MPATEITQQQELHTLYSSHFGWLQGWLRHKLGNAFEASDLAQDTFISILTTGSAPQIREARPFLATIARRLVAHRYRRQVLEEAYLAALACLPPEVAPAPEERLLALKRCRKSMRRSMACRRPCARHFCWRNSMASAMPRSPN